MWGGVLTTSKTSFNYLDGYKMIRPDEADKNADLFIIAIEKWEEPYKELLRIGIPDEKIIRGKAFYNPCFNLEKYLALKNSNCSILCNNCLAGIVSEELGLEFLSPTKNMACLKGEEFVDYVNNVVNYIDTEIDMIKWRPGIDDSFDCYDRIRVGGKVTFRLNHNVCAEDVVDDWKRRSHKINVSNIAVIMTLRERKDIDAFLRLDCFKKLGIYFEDTPLSDVIYLPEWKNAAIRFANSGSWDYFVTRYMSYHFENGKSPIDWISFLLDGKNYARRWV